MENRRGYLPSDEREFTGSSQETLRRAARELYFLLNHGYPVKNASTFIGNHYLLSERQRIALTRVVSPRKEVMLRRAKEKPSGETVQIDGFNTIITLETALSGSPVFRCMDGTFRDLAGLRGTYRLIDKTDAAIQKIFDRLRELAIRRAVFWLDAPVSNSGRLKARIAEIAEAHNFDVGIEIADHVDQRLYPFSNVISSDSVVLNHCPSWINLNGGILPDISGVWSIDLME